MYLFITFSCQFQNTQCRTKIRIFFLSVVISGFFVVSQEKIRIALYVQKAAWHFIDGTI